MDQRGIVAKNESINAKQEAHNNDYRSRVLSLSFILYGKGTHDHHGSSNHIFGILFTDDITDTGVVDKLIIDIENGDQIGDQHTPQ
jgi:hypothetical protein